MSLWKKISEVREDGSSQNETISDPGGDRRSTSLAADASPTPAFEVSEPEYCRIGFEEWVPAVYRGLDVVFPAKDWEITPSMVEQQRSFQEQPRALAVADCQPCPICQCVLFWETIGDRSGRICVECRPPSSPVMAEDLWVVDAAGWRRVSNEPRWKRAAFASFERRRHASVAVESARVAAANAGF